MSDDPAITNAGLANLARFAKLEALTLNQTGLADVSLAHELLPLTALHTLHLSESHAGPEALRVVAARASQLQTLGFTQASITDADLATLPPLLALVTLQIDNTPITGAGIPAGRLPALRYLSLKGCPLDSAAVAAWAGRVPASQCLFSDTPLTDAALPGLVQNSVQYLMLDNTRVTDAGLPTLAGCPALIDLSVAGTSITDAGLPAFGKLPALAHLNLARTGITDEGLPALLACRNLGYLNVTGCKITDASLPTLEALPQLQSLSAAGTQLSPAALQHLRNRGVTVVGP